MAASLPELEAALVNADKAGDVEAARTLASHITHLRTAEKIANDPISQGARNFNQDSSFLSNLASGAGKAVSDLGLGVRQLVGNASQQEVDETKARDAQLMASGGGVTGNVLGNVAMSVLPGLGAAGVGRAAAMPALQAAGKYALTAPSTIGGAATQGALGAIQSGLQPVATGEDRLQNTTLGLGGGAAIPVAGMALKGGKAAIEPLYEGGRNAILARALRSAAGENTDTAIRNMKGATELVPGSKPTAAEVANSGGIAAMQRAASAVDPEAYATRATQQNEARVAALQGLTGTAQDRAAAEGAREAAAAPHYKQAFHLGVDPAGLGIHPDLQAQVAELTKRPAVQDAIKEATTKAANEGVELGGDAFSSVKGMHYVKRAIDDQIANAAPDDARILTQLKNALLGTVDELSPEYAAGRKAFAAASKPINQMDVAGEIADKAVNKLTGALQPQAYARALSDDTAARATGFNKATLANTMAPAQLQLLEALKGDLGRSVAARDMGRGAGSDTVQKLAMTNLMQRSGIPAGLVDFPGIGRVGNWAYSMADDKMKQALAKALLNPKDTAKIMEEGVPSETARKLGVALRTALGPAAIGTVPAALDAR